MVKTPKGEVASGARGPHAAEAGARRGVPSPDCRSLVLGPIGVVRPDGC
jgi:hypothetical protein